MLWIQKIAGIWQCVSVRLTYFHRTNMSKALFVDKRLHEKELIIRGRTFPQTQILEAISLYSMHDGTIHDLYYYCVTCAIRASAPEDCECCQEPVELTETPIELKPLKIN